jgi:hypothetical protein
MLKNADPCGDVLLDEALKHIKVRRYRTVYRRYSTYHLPGTGLEHFMCVPVIVPYLSRRRI